MFQSALVRLTLWYIFLTMVLSICFSFMLYEVSTVELDRGLHRQAISMRNGMMIVDPEALQLEEIRNQQIQESEQHLRVNLFYFNLIILGLSGIASYLLAKRTLSPIEEALEAQNRFTADASHELRTPLTAMKTEIEVALRDKKLSIEDARSLFQSNLEEIERLDKLSGSLLKLASRTKTLDPKEVEYINLFALVKKVATKLDGLASKKEIVIKIEGAEQSVEGDRISLEELLTLIIENGIKYSQSKSEINVRVSDDNNYSKIEIVDQGMGIDQKDLPHIFDRFYRADISRSKENVEGYGLGLSIAKKIIDMHQGKVAVESEINKGSAFIIRLPKKQIKY